MINNLPAVVKNIQTEICLLRPYLLKLEFVCVGIDFYGVAVGELAGKKFRGKRILQTLLIAARKISATILKSIVLFLKRTFSCSILCY